VTILQIFTELPFIDIFHVLFPFMPNGILDLIQKDIMPQFLIDNFSCIISNSAQRCFRFNTQGYCIF
jgi:hypothetical protein